MENYITGVAESCIPAIYIVYTLIYRLKMYRKSEFEIWVCISEYMLPKRDFQLLKVEKQADIQPVYTGIQARNTINMCKKCEL